MSTATKPTAAKGSSKAAPPSKPAPPSKAPPQEAPSPQGEPEAKKQKLQPEQRLMNDGQTLLRRYATGAVKSATPEQIADAKSGLDLMKTMGRDDKIAFARKVEQTKGAKSFAWVRTFTEDLKTKDSTHEGVIENYYTRIVIDIMGHVGDTWG